MKPCRVESPSPEFTRALGAHLAADLGSGDVVTFRGELGSGKTCMIQGLCEALGVDDYVTSPTFILINEYRGHLHDEPVDIFHFDLYRLGSPTELEDLGAEEYFYGSGICLIEWPEHAEDLLPARRIAVTLEYAGATRRLITVSREGF